MYLLGPWGVVKKIHLKICNGEKKNSFTPKLKKIKMAYFAKINLLSSPKKVPSRALRLLIFIYFDSTESRLFDKKINSRASRFLRPKNQFQGGRAGGFCDLISAIHNYDIKLSDRHPKGRHMKK